MSKAKTMVKALRVLSKDIQSGDGVANACVADAADMIEDMSAQLAEANGRVERLEKIANGLCYAEGTVRGDKAYADWCDYLEQLRKEKEC